MVFRQMMAVVLLALCACAPMERHDGQALCGTDAEVGAATAALPLVDQPCG